MRERKVTRGGTTFVFLDLNPYRHLDMNDIEPHLTEEQNAFIESKWGVWKDEQVLRQAQDFYEENQQCPNEPSRFIEEMGDGVTHVEVTQEMIDNDDIPY